VCEGVLSDEEVEAKVATTEAEVQARDRKAARRSHQRRAVRTLAWERPSIGFEQRAASISPGRCRYPPEKSDSGNAASSTSSDHHASCIIELQAALAYCAAISFASPLSASAALHVPMTHDAAKTSQRQQRP
jgi:hypothetical protein